MGELLERSKLGLLVNGNGLAENYNNNNLFFFDKYKSPDKEVREVKKKGLPVGRFYFLHADRKETNNWMKWAPIFLVGEKQDGIYNILQFVNLNFIPFDERITIFDKYITEDNLDKDKALEVDFSGMYKELRKWGLEYSLVEYPAHRIFMIFNIRMDLVPRFLYSSHPNIKYDPENLYDLRNSKLKESDRRDDEMRQLLVSDFTAAEDEIKGKFKLLQDKVFRIQKSLKK
jgi:hypothetical protein